MVPDRSPERLVTSQRIEREGLGKRRTGTRQAFYSPERKEGENDRKCSLDLRTIDKNLRTSLGKSLKSIYFVLSTS